jgi:hypothetical protein
LCLFYQATFTTNENKAYLSAVEWKNITISSVKNLSIKTDWREIIYQMQKDYRQHNHDDDYALKIISNN